MTGGKWVEVVRMMQHSHGLATRNQIRDLGLPDRTLRRRLSQGLLVPVNSQVVALPGLPLDLCAVTRAAVLVHPTAIPTGPAAAAFLGSGPWDGADLGGEPWLIHQRSRAVRARTVTHPGVRVARVAGVTVARPADTVVDLIRFWPPATAFAVAQRGLALGAITLQQLVEAHSRLGGLAGTRQLRKILSDLSDGAHSEGERRLLSLLRDAAITGWTANHPVRAGGRMYILDVAFTSAKLAVEVDGHAFHSSPRSFQQDRRRQNDLVGAGWTVLRFTWADIVERPEYVVRTIVAGLELRRLA